MKNRGLETMKAIILAAGYATRMYPLTKDKPKALLPIGGKVMLDYLMDEVATIREIDTVYIVTNSRFAGQFSAWAEEAAARYPRLKLDVLDDGTELPAVTANPRRTQLMVAPVVTVRD